MAGPDPLAELRQIFRGELDDTLAQLEDEAQALAGAGGDPAIAGPAVAEIYRAVHSLKGAAHAVGYPDIERLCHALESRLAPARGGGPIDAAAITAELDGALRALRATAARLASGTEPAPHDEPRAGAPAPVAAESASDASARTEETVRVSVARLGDLFAASEELLALAGRQRALVARHGVLADLLATLGADLRRARQQLRPRADTPLDPEHEEAGRLLDRGLSTLQTLAGWSAEAERDDEGAWREVTTGAGELSARARALRVVAIDTLAPAIERAAGEISRALGRPVSVSVRGEGVEIDRRVRDGLREPLLHLVRNAIDHGIEPPEARLAAGKPEAGRVEIDARITGRDARIVVRDDGRGVDLAALRQLAASRGHPAPASAEPRELLALMFEPGISTRRDVSAFSGRGVGLDVVRQRIAQLHGRVEVESEPGRGSRFTLTVPVDLSVSPGLLVQVRDVRAVFMATAVERIRRASPADLASIEGRLYLQDEAGPIPLAELDAALGLSARPAARLQGNERWPCVVVAAGDRRAAFRVDALLDYHEVIVRPLGGRVRRAALVSGATVLGDGEVALVLEAADLLRVAQPASGPERAAEPSAPPRPRVLVVDDSVTTRQLERTILEAAGYEVTLAHDGQHAWEILAAGAVFDAILSDIEMPRLDGFQLLARVRSTSRTARLPFILVTALDRPSDRQRALDLGASAYLVKRSFDQESLLDTLEQLL